ncbi:PKD domain-containing protein [Candidatus Bathyarchaeota archaeon]|nr:MAG: PKD domain-containing protein [Candidatus Bathyarchaeota archaeon]
MAMPAGAPFDHIVTIMMENQALCSVYTGCGGSGTYESTLADQNSLVMTWGTINHNSEPNYIALFGAINDGSTSGDGVCCYFETSPNLVDKIESSGLTWQAFAEDAGNSGTCNFSPPRGGDHFGFIDFSDMNTASRCSHFLTTSSSSDPEFLAALNAPSPANFIWLTPNDNDNGHDSGVSGGDSYLAGLVPKILASTEFTTTKATLLVLYDEGYNQCASTGGTGECVYASFSGPVAKKGVQISPPNASHYSYLSTIEAAWGLSPINSNDGGAPNMLSAIGAACTTNCPPLPLSTSFTASPSTALVSVPVTFTATTSGGTAPYTISWNFGDGATGTGAISTQSYPVAQTFTVTETAKDSSSPQQTVTSSQTVTVSSSTSLTGNFGSCTSLPQGWSCGNATPSTSSATIVSGILDTRESNPGQGGSNSYNYATTQMGTFPWSPCQAPASGAIPSGVTSISSHFTFLAYAPSSTQSTDRYHIYIALYYWLPNGAVTAGGSTYQCLDTQVRVENVGGTFSSVGSTATYDPGDSFGWDQVTLSDIVVGQSYTLTADVAQQCQSDLSAWGLPSSTQCQLAGIEIGTEGYQFQELDVNWDTVSLTTGAPPPPSGLTTTISFTPVSPAPGQSISFKSTASGGTAPYAYSWNFGDGTTGTGSGNSHLYSVSGTYVVSLQVSDSIGVTASASTVVAVISANPLVLSLPSNQTLTVGSTLRFVVNATDANPGAAVRLIASGLPPGATFDSATGVFSWTPSTSQTGTYTIAFSAIDNSNPSQRDTRFMTMQVDPALPPGSNGGSGGATGTGSNGNCLSCTVIPLVSSTWGLLVVGGLFGLVASLVLVTVRARSNLDYDKRRMKRLTGDE